MAEPVQQWTDVGVVAPWEGRIGTLNATHWKPNDSRTTRYVGVPTMSAIGKHMAADLDVVLQCRVTKVVCVGDAWRLTEA